MGTHCPELEFTVEALFPETGLRSRPQTGTRVGTKQGPMPQVCRSLQPR